MGVVSPLGLDLATTWAGLVAGRSGIRALAGFDDQPVRIGGVVPDFDQVAALGVRVGRQLDRFAAFAVQAARQAVREHPHQRGEDQRDQAGDDQDQQHRAGGAGQRP